MTRPTVSSQNIFLRDFVARRACAIALSNVTYLYQLLATYQTGLDEAGCDSDQCYSPQNPHS
jgi:hypothetical protein